MLLLNTSCCKLDCIVGAANSWYRLFTGIDNLRELQVLVSQ